MAAAAEATREDADAATRVTVRSLATLAGMVSLTRGLQSLGQVPEAAKAVQPEVALQLVAPVGLAVPVAMEMSLVTAQEMYFTLLSKVRA